MRAVRLARCESGPISKQSRGAFRPKLIQAAHHGIARLARLHASCPSLRRRIQILKQLRNGARVLIAQLVAGFTTIGLNQVQPLPLVLDVR